MYLGPTPAYLGCGHPPVVVGGLTHSFKMSSSSTAFLAGDIAQSCPPMGVRIEVEFRSADNLESVWS